VLGTSPEYRELAALQPGVAAASRALRQQLPAEVVDEIAVPSYTHSCRLMRHLFWERLAVALEWLDRIDPKPAAAMDFGCGLGVLIPCLLRRGLTVTACDVHPEVVTTAARFLGTSGIQVLHARDGLEHLPEGSLDVILALDVLEHVDDLEELAVQFRRLLGSRGRLLCSLPTESALYRLGRRLAGFSGAYHVQQPKAVLTALSTCLSVRRVARLYPILPLFEFYEARA
jgi:2-polyprenyl-3-methyl-5-hydroxy-6-metoxy-1,4-benzoquinol methylase